MSDNQAVLAANQAFYRAFEQKNLEALSAIWLKGDNSVCIHPGRPPLKGWERISTSWDEIFKNTDSIQLTTETIAAGVSGNIAYVVLLEKLSQVIQGRSVDVQSIATNVFARTPEAWRLVHRHGSPILPMMPPNQQPPGMSRRN
ncbi:nuclear transport factor 2 family protein [Thermocoleostomius sinensis]|jgi:ketosteroid isomerase-like protein|uniref:Nuclear transport factor 2 family protein n=1 Tax=Thermocoleostomius sinensis A174 TaxID=2016057 RepID=A0A9E9CBF0_9CYAN|nr:nuclear transport factor 2 family protein [Thermocoleostomius sinensis]WAL60440.1 nuclear transport factor 2 family protein [Thermocoleostomius sinensis A174]